MNGLHVDGERLERAPGKFSPKLTPGQVADIKARLRAGETTRALALEYGVDQSAISYYRVRTVAAGRTLTEAEEWAVRDRLRAGWTEVAIAADLRLNRHTVAGVAARLRSAATSKQPLAERDPSWRDRAICRRIHGFTELPVEEQVQVCREGDGVEPDCPVRAECQEWGMRQAIPKDPPFDWPVYGGYSGDELYRLRQQMPSAGVTR